MFASTTQETLIQPNDEVQRDESRIRTLFRSISTIDANDFHLFLQQQYGACWGTLKFEDSLSDYTNEVRYFIDINLLNIFICSFLL